MANKSIVTVNDQEFVIGKMTPRQIGVMADIFSNLATRSQQKIVDAQKAGTLVLFMAIIGSLDENDVVRFAAALIGSDIDFARTNFDLEWVSEAFAMLMENSNLQAVVANFTRGFSKMGL